MLLPSALLALALGRQGPMFSDADRARLRQFWNEPGRVTVVPDARSGYVVNITPEGSLWLWSLNRALGQTSREPKLSDWVDSVCEYEYAVAQRLAWRQNVRIGTNTLGVDTSQAPKVPRLPGPAPSVQEPGLRDMLAAPRPPMYEVLPYVLYRVQLSSDQFVEFARPVVMRKKYAYYRSRLGVATAGHPVKSLSERDRVQLLAKAGLSASRARVMQAVSMLEGGFDAFNSYDTGGLSVGFLQFATLREGKGLLGQLLLQYKRSDPTDFDAAFRKYGIEVLPDASLVAANPETGFEAAGPDANVLIRDDLRLAAVFVIAGATRQSFQVAQIRLAKLTYFDPMMSAKLFVRFGDSQSTFLLSDVIRSEAGLATILDRYVNTGRMGPISETAQKFIDQYRLTSLAQLQRREREIVQALVFRRNYLDDSNLTQPGGP